MVGSPTTAYVAYLARRLPLRADSMHLRRYIRSSPQIAPSLVLDTSEDKRQEVRGRRTALMDRYRPSMHPYVGAKPSHFLGRSVFGGQGHEEASTMLGGKKKRSVWPKTATGDRICALTIGENHDHELAGRICGCWTNRNMIQQVVATSDAPYHQKYAESAAWKPT